ncbi:hypothetical protein [uncultured Croceitalea sp.]|uniref:hypothetical protein n=1 Tax=uncultured Croceitalea sp. TaxID=1798908 RepID=UPI003305922B
MRKVLFIITAFFTLTAINAQKLEKKWETSGLEAPESVVGYKSFYLVSNVAGQPAEKNGLGYISQLNKKGEIIIKKWSIGFNAPKGLGIHGENLYVADIDVVAVVDLNTGKIKKRFKAEGATFLNDIEITSDGSVFITDTFGGNAIYRVKDGEISLWLKNDLLNYPNGLKVKGDELFVSSWGVVTNPKTFETEVPGKLLSVNLKDKSIKTLTEPFGNLDGLGILGEGFLVSDWITGEIMTIDKNNKTQVILNLKPGSADLGLFENQEILIVPQMLEGKLTAYSVN